MEITLNRKYETLFMSHPDKRYIILTGGRGSGKSFVSSLWLAHRFMNSKMNSLYLREFMSNAAVSTIPLFLEQIEKLHCNFLVKASQIENSIGSKLYFRGFKSGSASADSNLKSLTNIETVLIEEATEIGQREFNKLDLSLRAKGADLKIMLVLNPTSRLHWIWRDFFEEKREDTLYIHTTYHDNIDNLSPSFLKEAERVKSKDYLLYLHCFEGEWTNGEAEALFKMEDIENSKSLQAEEDFSHVVVAIDPAVSVKASSDETGLCVAAKGYDGKYTILDCFSIKATPKTWAERAVQLADLYKADKIIYESNQGGLLVKETIENVSKNFKVEPVTATKGKILRAEPIKALFEKQEVKLKKDFPQLEKEMLTFTGSPHDASPNCLDAMVWALTSLRNTNTFTLRWG